MACRPKAPIEVKIDRHQDKRTNIPPAEMEPLMADEDKSPIRVAYERCNRDLDSFEAGCSTKSVSGSEPWVNLVFGCFESWRCIWLDCRCDTTSQRKRAHHHGREYPCRIFR